MVLIISIGVGCFFAFVSYQMSLIPSMTFEETIAYTTKNNEKARITVGILQNGEMSFTVYGNSASILSPEEHIYEIGSITKTFTTSLLCKAINGGLADLNAPINQYIELPEKEYYPTLKRLVTHTSGYKGHYFEKQMVSNFFHGEKNDFYKISQDSLLQRIGKVTLQDKDYEFQYSNFGLATVGMVLSKIYNIDYTNLMNTFIREDLNLNNTKLSNASGDLSGYWNWAEKDAYMPAGAIKSKISDIMKYINLHMSDKIPYLTQGHEQIAVVNATTSQYEKMDIRMDAVGIGWMIDTKHNIIWHNGSTSNFNSYAAFDKENQIGVVILSNLAPNYRIPATVMGTKLILDLRSGKNHLR